MNHAMRLVQKGTTWDYSCSCKKVKKTGLKARSSADILHSAHLRTMNASKMATPKSK